MHTGVHTHTYATTILLLRVAYVRIGLSVKQQIKGVAKAN